jgi:thymidylate kinase
MRKSFAKLYRFYLTLHEKMMQSNAKSVVIVFIGNVGAGKTTHIYALSKALNKLGYSIHVTTLKTIFPFTQLTSPFAKHNISLLRIAVSLDLVFNDARLPILALIKTVVWPLLRKRQIVLLDEHLPGSLVDYVYNGIVYGIIPVSLIASRILIRLFALLNLLHFNIVYLYCNKEILPKRWIKRGTLPEKKLYLIIQDSVFTKFTKRWNNVLMINSEKEFILNHRIIRDFVIDILRKRIKPNLRSE